MNFHFPKARFWISSTRVASGGKGKKSMALLVVCRTFSPILMHVCSYHYVVIPSNYVQIVDNQRLKTWLEQSRLASVEVPSHISNIVISDTAETLFKAKALFSCVSSQASS